MVIIRLKIGQAALTAALMVFLFLMASGRAHSESLKARNFVDVNAGVGLPRLISFRVSAIRLYPVTFGFGFGTIPIENAARRHLGISPSDYAQQIKDITVTPNFSLDWSSFEAFLRWYVSSSPFYLHAAYSVWNISGNVSAMASGGSTLGSNSINLGTASLTLAQPLYGLSAGWRFDFGKSRVYCDVEGGVIVFGKPNYSVGLYTAADAYQGLIPGDVRQQIEDGKETVRSQAAEAMQKYRDVVKYSPALSLSFGVTI